MIEPYSDTCDHGLSSYSCRTCRPLDAYDATMRTRDVLRWNFAPWDMLLVAGIALAAFALGVCDAAVDALERAVDRVADGNGRATYTAEVTGPPTTSDETGAGESQGPRGFGDRITPGWRLR